MAFVKDAGKEGCKASDEWDGMNRRNQAKINEWVKAGKTKVNEGREIGVQMIEWID